MPDEIAELIAPPEPIVTPVLPEVVIPGAKPESEIHEEPIPEPSVHPLQPGGRRFEQVYAEAKQAQRDRDEERDKRIRAETQLEMLTKTQKTADKEYEWPELEAMIATGQITRADAQAHRELVTKRHTKEELKQEVTQEAKTNTRLNALSNGIQAYLNTVPDLSTKGTELYSRVDREFDWLASVQGLDPASLSDVQQKSLALAAMRNVLGPVETLSKRLATPNAATHQGFVGGTPPAKKVNPDQALLDKLTPVEVEHYKRMFTMGKYPGKWVDVVAELKYVPPVGAH